MKDASVQLTRAQVDALGATTRHIRARTKAAAGHRAATRPYAGSPEKAVIRSSRGNDAGQLAELLLVSADYHLETFAVVLGAPMLFPIGGYTLLRGAAEPAARAAWLMEPKATRHQRLGRALVERLYSLKQQALFKRRKKDVTDQIDRLVLEAGELGFKAIPNQHRPKEIEHFGEPRPGATSLFGKLLPDIAQSGADPIGSDVYKILSGYAHSVPWAIFLEGESFAGGEPGFKWLKVDLRLPFQLLLLQQVLRLHDIAHDRISGRVNRPNPAWREVMARLPPMADPVEAFDVE